MLCHNIPVIWFAQRLPGNKRAGTVFPLFVLNHVSHSWWVNDRQQLWALMAGVSRLKHPWAYGDRYCNFKQLMWLPKCWLVMKSNVFSLLIYRSGIKPAYGGKKNIGWASPSRLLRRMWEPFLIEFTFRTSFFTITINLQHLFMKTGEGSTATPRGCMHQRSMVSLPSWWIGSPYCVLWINDSFDTSLKKCISTLNYTLELFWSSFYHPQTKNKHTTNK